MTDFAFPKKQKRRRKPAPGKDPALLKRIASLPCLACPHGAQTTQTDPDHIITVGAGGHDTISNVWPLCRIHHTERHKQGLVHMASKYNGCMLWFKDHGKLEILEVGNARRAGVLVKGLYSKG